MDKQLKNRLDQLIQNNNFILSEIKINDVQINICFHRFLADVKQFNKFFMDRINNSNYHSLDKIYPGVYYKIQIIDNDINNLITNGNIFMEVNDYLYLINMQNNFNRSISDSILEPTNIYGSRDGFTESIEMNISLIQKRIKCSTFNYQRLLIGKRSQTDVYVLYIEDICNKKNIERVVNILNHIDIDAIQSIKDITNPFEKKTNGINYLFPTTAEIGTPEIAATSLYEGRIVLLINNFPVAITLPVDITYFVTLKENNYTSPTITLKYRIIFYILFFLAVFFLGIYAAIINFHTKNVSLIVISEIKASLQGTTLPIFIEFIFIIFLFDILRLATTKSPNINIQNIIVIVGGLLIGQNAVNSGFISAFNLVITAISYISCYALTSNQRFIMALRILRIVILLSGLILGILGVIIASIISIFIISKNRSLDTPYLSPLLPFIPSDFIQTFLSKNIFKKFHRNKNLETIDETRGVKS